MVGLDSYFFGASGALGFQVAGRSCQAAIDDGTVSVSGNVLETGEADAVIGTHDFTGDRNPELMVARRTENAVKANVYTYAGGKWKLIGQMAVPGGQEIRIFRQVISVRRDDVLCSWTWHKAKFDYKASDGSDEPTL